MLGKRFLFKIADDLEINLEDNEIQRLHPLGQKKGTMRIHAQPFQDLCHTKQETSFLLTNGNSKISKEDSM